MTRAGGITITVTNEREFRAALEKMRPPKGILREAVKAGAEVAVEGEQSRVHVDTGNLRASIGMDPIEESGDAVWTTVGPSDDRAPGRDVSPYAEVEEYRVGGNAQGAPFDGPHAFVRPTADEDADAISGAMEAVLRRFYK